MCMFFVKNNPLRERSYNYASCPVHTAKPFSWFDQGGPGFLVEGALYYERDTKFQEPKCSQHGFLVEGALYYERDTKFQEPLVEGALYYERDTSFFVCLTLLYLRSEI